MLRPYAQTKSETHSIIRVHLHEISIQKTFEQTSAFYFFSASGSRYVLVSQTKETSTSSVHSPGTPMKLTQSWRIRGMPFMQTSPSEANRRASIGFKSSASKSRTGQKRVNSSKEDAIVRQRLINNDSEAYVHSTSYAVPRIRKVHREFAGRKLVCECIRLHAMFSNEAFVSAFA